jgi:hypothetical protein
VLADSREHQPRTVGHGPASQQRADLLEVAPVGGLVRHHPPELAVHRIIEDGTPEAVPVQRLNGLGEEPEIPQPAGPLRRGRRRERGFEDRLCLAGDGVLGTAAYVAGSEVTSGREASRRQASGSGRTSARQWPSEPE